MECSAATQVGVKEIFDYAIRAVLDPQTLTKVNMLQMTVCQEWVSTIPVVVRNITKRMGLEQQLLVLVRKEN